MTCCEFDGRRPALTQSELGASVQTRQSRRRGCRDLNRTDLCGSIFSLGSLCLRTTSQLQSDNTDSSS
eukprot:3591356-Rhodomonas_salina.1